MRTIDDVAHEYLTSLEAAEAVASMNSAAFIMFISECQRRGVVNPLDMTLGQVAEICNAVSLRYLELYGDC